MNESKSIKKKRSRLACAFCKKGKLKCDVESCNPCSQCKRRNVSCELMVSTKKRGRKPKTSITVSSTSQNGCYESHEVTLQVFETSSFVNTPAPPSQKLPYLPRVTTIDPPRSSVITSAHSTIHKPTVTNFNVNVFNTNATTTSSSSSSSVSQSSTSNKKLTETEKNTTNKSNNNSSTETNSRSETNPRSESTPNTSNQTFAGFYSNIFGSNIQNKFSYTPSGFKGPSVYEAGLGRFAYCSIMNLCVQTYNESVSLFFPFGKFSYNASECWEMWQKIILSATPSLTESNITFPSDLPNLLSALKYGLVFAHGLKIVGMRTDEADKFVYNTYQKLMADINLLPVKQNINEVLTVLLNLNYYFFVMADLKKAISSVRFMYHLAESQSQNSVDPQILNRLHVIRLANPKLSKEDVLKLIDAIGPQMNDAANQVLLITIFIRKLLGGRIDNFNNCKFDPLPQREFMSIQNEFARAEYIINKENSLSSSFLAQFKAIIYASKAAIYFSNKLHQETMFWAKQALDLLNSILIPSTIAVMQLNLMSRVFAQMKNREILAQVHKLVNLYVHKVDGSTALSSQLESIQPGTIRTSSSRFEEEVSEEPEKPVQEVPIWTIMPEILSPDLPEEEEANDKHSNTPSPNSYSACIPEIPPLESPMGNPSPAADPMRHHIGVISPLVMSPRSPHSCGMNRSTPNGTIIGTPISTSTPSLGSPDNVTPEHNWENNYHNNNNVVGQQPVYYSRFNSAVPSPPQSSEFTNFSAPFSPSAYWSGQVPFTPSTFNDMGFENQNYANDLLDLEDKPSYHLPI
eukprot:TRINITY_DN608_c0_g1_i2.p1 TRINITY_DN608_c0_g1~~TRINITY_DN608_c0_g1_i2.p1  ORF type:complete len:802 (+),score=171.68 TRINITY_DN608_c0_g1_i2:17-2422(+)